MTDVAQQSEQQAPSTDTQAAIAAIFNESPNVREMATAQQVLASQDSQQASPSATDPNAQANAPIAPQGQQAAPTGQGQAVSPADAQNQSNPAMVPVAALTGERERRQQAEQAFRDTQMRLAQLEGYIQALQTQPQQQSQPQTPVDPNPLPQHFRSEEDFLIADPKGYSQWLRTGAERAATAVADKARQDFESQVRDIAWQNDDIRAKQTYGSEFVEQVKAYVKADPKLSRQFSQYKDPYTRAAQWAREEQVRRAIPNGDLNAARAQWLQEALQNPEILRQIAPQLVAAQPSPAAVPPSSVPPSLGSIARSAGHTGAFQSTEDAVSSLFASRRTG